MAKINARSDKQAVFIIKYCMPLIFVVGGIWMMTGESLGSRSFALRALLLFPIILLGIRNLTAAEIRLAQSQLEYRRFRRWKIVPYTLLVESRHSLIPGLSYATLLAPKGRPRRLYFISQRLLFERPKVDLVSLLSERLRPNAEGMGEAGGPGFFPSRNWGRHRALMQFFVVATGVVVSLCLTAFSSRSYQAEISWVSLPSWAVPALRFLTMSGGWLSAAVVFALLLVTLRFARGPSRFVVLLVTGCALGKIVVRLMLG